MNTQTKTVNINLIDNPYNVYVGAHLLDEVATLKEIKDASSVVVITDDTVAKLYLPPLVRSLKNAGFNTHSIVFDTGEKNKNLKTLSDILNKLSYLHLDRQTVFIGLGGGVVCDMAGLVASIWMRGCKLIQLPTSLLAMVDASCGGKNAIDLETGKNLVGTFWQPSAVVCDILCLESLTSNLFCDSVAEIIKHAAIADKDMFNSLKANPFLPGSYTQTQTIDLIAQNIEIKKSFVVADTHESNVRKILNFGHTIGHAIERASNYKYGHGKSVGLGMCYITRAAAHLGICQKELTDELEALIKSCNLETKCEIDKDIIFKYALLDKKMKHDKLSCIFVEDIAQPKIIEVNKQQLKDIIYLGE